MDLGRFSTIETERLRLVPLSAIAPGEYVEALADPDITRWLSETPEPFTLADAQARIAAAAESAAPRWAILDDSGLAGGISLRERLGYWVAKRAQGRGYATEAARAVLAAYFSAPEAGEPVRTSFMKRNAASAKVLHKLGFEVLGPSMIPSQSRGRLVKGTSMVLTRQGFEAAHGPVLRTARLCLRRAYPADFDALWAFVSDYDTVKTTGSWPVPPDPALTARRCLPIDPARGMGGPVLSDQEIVGWVTAVDGELGYMIGRAHWGRGYATEIAQALLAHIGARYDWPRIEACVFADNPGSARVLEKLGFAEGAGCQSHCAARGGVLPTRTFSLPLTRAHPPQATA